MSRPGLAGSVEATLLRADAREVEIDALTETAARLGCAAVCVNPVHVKRAAAIAAGSGLRVVSVAGFPLGASPAVAKIAECRHALERGASELDIVIPIWAAIEGRLDRVEEEMTAILEATAGATRKFILEMPLLESVTLKGLAALFNRLRPEYAKTGTGFQRPVTAADVTALRGILHPAIAIKAAGGIRGAVQAEALLLAGASRLGTSRPEDLIGPT